MFKKSNKIDKTAPALSSSSWYHQVEIRPGRNLRLIVTNSDLTTGEQKDSNIDLLSFSSQHDLRNVSTATEQNMAILHPLSHIAIFFIHGVGGSADVWQMQIEHFRSIGFCVICPDLIGHGFSGAPRAKHNYEFKEICLDVLSIFDRFSKQLNVVVGHSYGASFATVLSHERPHKVHKLVLVSGGSPTPLAPQVGVFSLPICMLTCCHPIISKAFNRNAFHDTKSHELAEAAFDVPSYVLKNIMNGQHWSEGGVDYHKELQVETLIIHGNEDKLVNLAEEYEMKLAIEGSQLVTVADAGHMVMMEKPQQVNYLITRFLADIL